MHPLTAAVNFTLVALMTLASAQSYIVTLETSAGPQALSELKTALEAKSVLITHTYDFGSFRGYAFRAPLAEISTAEAWQEALAQEVEGEIAEDGFCCLAHCRNRYQACRS